MPNLSYAILELNSTGLSNYDCCHARRHCRRLERQYRRTSSADDRRLWVDAVRGRLRLLRAKKEAYWLDRLSQNGRLSPLVWTVEVTEDDAGSRS